MQESRAWRPLAAGLFIAFGLNTGPAALAHEAHTHQHGVASLELSQEADTLVIAFRSPLDSLVGFETRPANARQRQQIARLSEQLKDAGRIVNLPAAAGCAPQHIDIDSPEWLESGHDDDHDHRHEEKAPHTPDDEGHGHGHDRKPATAAGDDDGHDHDRGAKAHAHPGGHAKSHGTAQDAHAHGKEGHDADDDHAHEHAGDAHHANDGHEHGHADLAVSYTLRCSNLDALKTLTVSAFGTWPKLRQIDVAAVSDRGQKAARLTPKQNTLRW
ncbi:MAG: DUF2796 domain-containing protein [Lautropia sp.]|nr:DUF2796 domain-containing protein [Lautropia sp.]